MRLVLFLSILFAAASCTVGEGRAAVFRRSCNSGSCNVGSTSCNVSSSQSCNISGAAAPASVIVQPQAATLAQAPAFSAQSPLRSAPGPTFPAPRIEPAPASPLWATHAPVAAPTQPTSLGDAGSLAYDLASAAQFCAAPTGPPSSDRAWPPAMFAERARASLAMIRAFR